MIKGRNISFSNSTKKICLKDVGFDISTGAFLGIYSARKEDRKALLDIIAGTLVPESGVIDFNGSDILDLENRHKKMRIAYCISEATIPNHLTVAEYFDFNSLFYENYDKNFEKEMCFHFSVNERLRISELCFQERQKVMLISAFASGSDILLIDELFKFLEESDLNLIVDFIYKIKNESNRIIICSSDNRKFLSSFSENILFINEGRASYHSLEEFEEMFDLKDVAA